jgi:hypothetical protein
MRQETKETLVNTFKESALILVYEFLGTICFTLLYINSASERILSVWIADPINQIGGKDYKAENIDG